MCLGVPGKVIEVDREMQIATVDCWGDDLDCDLGYDGIRRIAPEDAAETLALYDELLRLADEQDLMTADIRGEIDAAPDANASSKGAPDESQ